MQSLNNCKFVGPGLRSGPTNYIVYRIKYMADDNRIIFSMFRVGKIYPPHRQVLKDISLSFFLGAKIGIIGLNGSGKSTLLTDNCRPGKRVPGW